jgi:hypothetical protein
MVNTFGPTARYPRYEMDYSPVIGSRLPYLGNVYRYEEDLGGTYYRTVFTPYGVFNVKAVREVLGDWPRVTQVVRITGA